MMSQPSERRTFGAPVSESQLNSRLSIMNSSRLSLNFRDPKTPKSILKQPLGNANNNNSNRLTLGANSLNLSLNSSTRQSSAHNMNNSLLNSSQTPATSNKSGGHHHNRSHNDETMDVKRLIKCLIQYLAHKNYPYEINLRKLVSPSASEFATVFEFLVSQLDPSLRIKLPTPSQLKKENMELETKNQRRTTFKPNTSLLASVKDRKTSVNGFDEQVFIDLINYFKYPSSFNINQKFVEKSGFTPRGWGKLLSVAVWFTDLLRYYEYRDERLRLELQDDHEGIFFTYLLQTYTYWMNGDEENLQRVVNEWQKDFYLKAQSLEVQSGEIATKTGDIRKTINTIIPRLQERKVLESQKVDFIADLAKFEASNRELEQDRLELEDAIAIDDLELSSLQSEIMKLTRERDSLRQQIDQQELKPQDVLRMNKNRASLEDDMKKIAEERDIKNNILFSLENESRSEGDLMMRKVQQYNQLAMMLPIDTEDEVDDDGDYNLSNNFDLIVTQEYVQDIIPSGDLMENSQPDQHSKDETLTLSCSYQKHISNPLVYQTNIDLFDTDSKIRRMKDDMIKSIRSMQEHVYELNEKYDSAEDRRQRQEEHIKELERQLEKEKIQIASNKQDWDKEVQRIYFEIDEVEQETKIAKNTNQNLSSLLTESERRIQQLEKEQQLVEAQFEAELVEMNKLLVKVATSVYEHKEHIQKMLGSVRDHRASIVESVSGME